MSTHHHVRDRPPAEWELPGAQLVCENVHRIPLPLPDDGLRAVNVYAIQDGADLVLIDSGWALDASRAALEAGLAQIGFDLGQVREFLVTHAHSDHYTQACVLRRLFGSRVALGSWEQANLASMHDGSNGKQLAGLMIRAGAPQLVAAIDRRMSEHDGIDLDQWQYPDEWLHDRRVLQLSDRTLEVFETPGHTKGHVVFRDESAGVVFTGDHLLPHITPSVGFEPSLNERPLAAYLASLQLMLELDDALMLPAHGPVGMRTHERTRQLIEHHDERLRNITDLVGTDATTALAVASRLTWTRRHRAFGDLDEFNQLLAIHETLAHLDVLADRDRLVRSEADGVLLYESP